MKFKKITIMIPLTAVMELTPLYEEDKAFRKAFGLYEKTFEMWCGDMLSLGCIRHIIKYASFINAIHNKRLEEKENA